VLVLGLALALSCLPLRAAAPETAAGPTVGTAVLNGKVLGLDGSTLDGATVVAYHLSTERVFRSSASGSGGEFRITDLPYGYYDIAVETPQGLYVGQVVNVPPAGKVVATLRLGPFTGADAAEQRAFRGSDTPAVGVARLDERASGTAFWRSPKGVAILAGAGGAVLLALAAGDDPPASTSEP
jgi:hypothetical protein